MLGDGWVGEPVDRLSWAPPTKVAEPVIAVFVRLLSCYRHCNPSFGQGIWSGGVPNRSGGWWRGDWTK
jgi:hypothetical protein